jgi:CheY-like chemotaxis protein
MHKILVVDDEDYVHRLLQHYLQRAGYQLVSAHNGREALDVAIRELPELIIMDVMMAEMDGITAIRKLKEDELTRKIPVIVITANPAYHISRDESQVCGAQLFLTKPFSPAQLMEAIRQILPDAKDS